VPRAQPPGLLQVKVTFDAGPLGGSLKASTDVEIVPPDGDKAAGPKSP